VLSLALAFGCSPKSERPLRLALVQQPNSLDPLRAVQFYENYIAEALFSALVVVNDRGGLSPDLAEVVPTKANGGISADGKTLVYHLRPGLRWQDGRPLSSHDVAFTLAKMRDPKTEFPEASVYSIVARIDTPDDRTVVVRLRSPWADATAELFVGGQDGSIVPAHLLASFADLPTSSFESHPVGSGPYALESWERGVRLVLRANPQYFRGPPHIGRIEIDFVPDQNTLAALLRTGEIDFSPQLPQTFALQLRDLPNLRELAVPTYNQLRLQFNTRRPPFSDARVRRAFDIAVDRSRLVTTVYRGFAVPGDDVSPPQSPYHTADPSLDPGGNLPAANRLLASAGWSMGSDGLRHKDGTALAFALTIQTGYPAAAAAAVQLQATWRALGADVTLRPMFSNVLLAPDGTLARGNFNVVLVPYGETLSPDRADELTRPGFPPSGRNYGRFDDPDVDRWTAQARATPDVRARRALYARISRRLAALAPQPSLVWQKQLYVVNRELEGLRPETVNSDFWNVAQWRLR
jgi:peptide/nickel transport system substrate-binding protein